MIDHSELIEEMEEIHKMTDMERIILARKRRVKQLEAYNKYSKREPISQKNIESRRRTLKFSSDAELLDAATASSFEDIKKVLEKGANPDSKNYEGLTSLHQACIDGSEEIVNLLLKYGANVNITDSDQWTPLHAAATCGHLNVVKILVENEAILLAVNGDGDMPHDITEDEETIDYLHSAIKTQGITTEELEKTRNYIYHTLKTDITEIIQLKKDINVSVTSDNATYLHVCIAHGYNDLVKLLLDEKASDEIKDNDGWLPVHVAAYWGNREALKYLVEERNTNLRATNNNNEMPYELCDDSATRVYILETINNQPEKYASFDKVVNDNIEEENEILDSELEDAEIESVEEKSTLDEEEIDHPIQAIINPTTIENLVKRSNSISRAKKEVVTKRSDSFDKPPIHTSIDESNLNFNKENEINNSYDYDMKITGEGYKVNPLFSKDVTTEILDVEIEKQNDVEIEKQNDVEIEKQNDVEIEKQNDVETEKQNESETEVYGMNKQDSIEIVLDENHNAKQDDFSVTTNTIENTKDEEEKSKVNIEKPKLSSDILGENLPKQTDTQVPNILHKENTIGENPRKNNKKPYVLQSQTSLNKNYTTSLGENGSNLADLKQKRRLVRQQNFSNLETPTWYNHQKNIGDYYSKNQFPPSPTLVKHKFVQPTDMEIVSNIKFKRNKCIIM